MNEKKDYTVKADGWVAGKWRAKGSTVSLTAVEAKYENVTLVLIGIDLAGGADETVVTEISADKAKAETNKRSRTKK
ncbi:hypothetical protein GTA62_13065 [Roseobacter sp. HKCCD9010]|uniref:hypothetical protein n=1 Tax=unclassified Roseobacter TaxID=196798 RepID=UPI001492F2E3|nr:MULTISPECIES: hypothetical protein [unclassified Roseobacter]MBF9049886.1 hypothetical protein [Rhodobacterales bacterium HKCCD4356]NNV13575.1 hypothetical protein [Roseobacter sp. HKCCD7357]NNV16409.1 hypothetical protein [Roseobacter sp. HKCCD8768]NNV25868.1 hypothetical protein [Roseobacter sp. HKCCD8192]NNV30126.1 hypothetical protein [Roseobacter sp. HKCCD9061]